MEKLKRIDSTDKCKDCVGNKSDSWCVEVSKEAAKQGLKSCVGGYIYVKESK